MEQLESEIAEWRAFVGQRPAVGERDVEELEAHLRDQIADLDAAGLAADEAFLIAVKRMGTLDELSREFAREHSRTPHLHRALSRARTTARRALDHVPGVPEGVPQNTRGPAEPSIPEVPLSDAGKLRPKASPQRLVRPGALSAERPAYSVAR